MAKSLTEMAADIVSARIGHTDMNTEEIAEALKATFNSLAQLKNSEDSESSLEAVEEAENEQVDQKLLAMRTNPRKSIKKAKVFCLECGAEFKQLTNGHLKVHEMNTKQYRKKWGFTARQPLSSQTLSAMRRKSAEDRNLGEQLKKARQKKKEKQAAQKKTTRKKAAK